MCTLLVSSGVVDPVSAHLRRILRMRMHADPPVDSRYDDAEKSMARVRPEMVIVSLSPTPERGLETLRRLRPAANCCVVAVGQTNEPKLILRALDSGADHYLDESDLENSLNSVFLRLRTKRDVAAPSGQLLAILGVSGGSGASTVAVNVAAALAQQQGKAGLIDLKPGRGDLAALLDLKPSFHLADLCQNQLRLNQAMLSKAMMSHSSKVSLLASPQLFGDARLVNANGVNQILGLARGTFTHIVADLEDCFHEEQLAALRQASAILLVTRLDFTSLRNLRRVLDYLEERGIPLDQIRIAVNRFGQPNELPADEAEKAINGKLSFFIPDDARTINGANNTGVPAVLKSPNAKVSLALMQMAGNIFERRLAKTALTASSWF